MCREDCIFEIDLIKASATQIYEFIEPLEMQPNTFISNYDQSIFIICSNDCAIYYNKKENVEIHLNRIFDASEFKSAIYDIEERMFYICCNR